MTVTPEDDHLLELERQFAECMVAQDALPEDDREGDPGTRLFNEGADHAYAIYKAPACALAGLVVKARVLLAIDMAAPEFIDEFSLEGLHTILMNLTLLAGPDAAPRGPVRPLWHPGWTAQSAD